MSPHPGSGPHQNVVVGEKVTHEEAVVVAPPSLASNSTASRAPPPNPRKFGPPPHHGLTRNEGERGGGMGEDRVRGEQPETLLGGLATPGDAAL
jgi:hypothetical protein